MNLDNKSIVAVLNTLSEAYIIIDVYGRVNFLNDTATGLTGYKCAEAKGMKFKEILKTGQDTDGLFENLENTTKSDYKHKLEIIHKNGRIIPVESTRHTLKDPNENICGVAEVFKIFSKDESLLPDVKDSESKYRRLFESSKDMIFIISSEGIFLDINQAMVDLLEYKEKKELFSLKDINSIFINPIHWRVCKKHLDKDGFVKDFEVGFKKKDGTRLHGNLSANTYLDDNGDILGYEGIAKDITARMDSFRRLYKHHQELVLLNTIALTMNSSQNLGDMLGTALNKTMKLLNFSIGAIFLINHDKSSFDLQTQKGLPDKLHNTSINPVFFDSKLMEFFMEKNNRLEPKSIFPSFKIRLESLGKSQSVIFACFLITEKEHPSGFMAFPFDEAQDLVLEDFNLLGSLGNFLGGSIANIKLIRTVRKHREELKRLAAKLFHSREFECKRISRELHDETGSALIGINFNLEAVEKIIPQDNQDVKNIISSIKQQVNHTYQEMRRISHMLHPALLTDLGLEPALDAYLSERAGQNNLSIDFKMIGFTGRINPDIETVLYRFSQEALSNTIKYANANFFKLSIIRGYPSIIFIAEDDGIGFDPGESDVGRPSLGLLSMKERAAILGGNFTLRTGRDKGTRIRIEIPIKSYDQTTLIAKATL